MGDHGDTQYKPPALPCTDVIRQDHTCVARTIFRIHIYLIMMMTRTLGDFFPVPDCSSFFSPCLTCWSCSHELPLLQSDCDMWPLHSRQTRHCHSSRAQSQHSQLSPSQSLSQVTHGVTVSHVTVTVKMTCVHHCHCSTKNSCITTEFSS
jgi:hypothetical protein